ncbi:MAG: type II toxin-antitoxin system VapC family toxin [Deltaproteobacteria bacterium]|nr:type II toxin-antitoxin system VapC family toxin [Deltaproteobacteria bacterium]
MGGRFLLDTNIIIALFSEDLKIREHIANASEVFVPSIAIGELYFGAYKSSKIQENHARIDEFALINTVLPCNADTARRYGDIKFRLKEKGRPIPENDIWIAAIAQQYDLTLVTRDTHFEAVGNFKIEVW